MNGESKVTRSHRERTAVVYVRQSTLAQVREHTECAARQYALRNLAERLGWAPDRVTVIDTDLGLSGRSAEGRTGFREIVTRVCLGEIGAVFGLEVSRLARSSADVQRLLELARLTDTLLIDEDGVHDLADFNDQLVLGLKGTMSQAELHLLKGRMDGAKRAAAGRGELRLRLPAGYLYDQDGLVVIDPDDEVASAVAEVFAAFHANGSAYAVVAVFAGRRFPRRVHGGPFHGQLRWGALNHARVLEILANPVYAGAHAYGRRPTRQRVTPQGDVHAASTRRARVHWPVLIQDHHPGYITWEQYEVDPVRWTGRVLRSGSDAVARLGPVALLVLGGAEHAVGRVSSTGVVEAFDEVEAGGLGLGAGGEVAAVEQFALERGEEALGDRVVVAVADRAGGRAYAGFAAAPAEGERRILASLVAVMDRTGARPAVPDRHLERVDDQLGAQVLGDRPSDDLSGEHVQDDGEVEPALAGGHVGDLGGPGPVRCGAVKSRSTRSCGGNAEVSRRVSPRFPRRCTPSRRDWRMSRATRLRPIRMP